MKKKTLLTLVLALAMTVSMVSAVFAADEATGAPTEVTKQAIIDAGVQCSQKIAAGKGEVTAEAIALRLMDTTADGGYGLIDTETLTGIVKDKGDVVIVDTMPQGWFDQRHIPGAICSEVGKTGPAFEFEGTQKDDLYKAVKAAVGTKKVTKWYNKKTKKWTTKKPPKKYRGKSKKVSVINKDKTIVVYCGFVGCERSHQGAKFLVEKGFKNVFRYAGGISAWVDNGNDIAGSDVAK